MPFSSSGDIHLRVTLWQVASVVTIRTLPGQAELQEKTALQYYAVKHD